MGSPEDDDRYGIPVHTFDKNKKERIRIALNEYKGHQYIDIRTFYLENGEYKPSSKGVTMKTEFYPDLLKGVMDLAGVLGIDPETITEAKPGEEPPGSS
jgi:hypothetical protein